MTIYIVYGCGFCEAGHPMGYFATLPKAQLYINALWDRDEDRGYNEFDEYSIELRELQ